MSDFYYVGFTRSSTPLALFERLAIDRERQSQLEHQLAQHFGECFVLSTCQRIECYIYSDSKRTEYVLSALTRAANIKPATVQASVQERTGLDVAEHLFQVSAGLKSRIMGESQILRQVRSAYLVATENRSLGPHLDAMVRGAIHVGKQARRDVFPPNAGPSWAKIAVSALQHSLKQSQSKCSGLRPRRPTYIAARPNGKRYVWFRNAIVRAQRSSSLHQRRQIQGQNILLLGTGKLAVEIMRQLSAYGFKDVTIISRKKDRAKNLCISNSHRTATMNQLTDQVVNAEGIIACTRCDRPVITADMLSRRKSPLSVIDLGVPRNVEPSAAHIPGIDLIHLDDLGASIFDGQTRKKIDHLIKVERDRFARWLRARRNAPIIKSYLRANHERDMQSRAQIHEAIVRIREQVAA